MLYRQHQSRRFWASCWTCPQISRLPLPRPHVVASWLHVSWSSFTEAPSVLQTQVAPRGMPCSPTQQPWVDSHGQQPSHCMLVNMRHMGKQGSRPLWSRHHARSNTWPLQLHPGPLRLCRGRSSVPLIYANAFFQVGDMRHKASDLRNGFDGVLFPANDRLVFFHGFMLGWVSQHLAARGQIIFVLEALAQMLAFVRVSPSSQSPNISSLVSGNTVAQFALCKGYSTDRAISTLTLIIWASATCLVASPWFERVTSAANN